MSNALANEPRSDRPDTPRERWWVVLGIAAAVAYGLLGAHAARLETPTVDEFAHLPAGCAYWKLGRLDLYCKNPPLLRYWMALPVVLDPRVNVPEIVEPVWDWGPWQYGVRFMNANRPGYLDIFFRARLMVLVLGLATGVTLWSWSRALFGTASAALVTALFLLSPNVLAHAHLATTDAGCMFSIFGAVFTLRWAYRRPRWHRFLVVGVVLGLALAVKFTALLLIPLFIGLGLLQRLLHGTTSPWRRAWAAAADVGISLLSALLVLHLVMGFRGTLIPLRAYAFSSSFCREIQGVLPGGLPVPLPEMYVVGFDGQKMDAESGEFGTYLLGRWSPSGCWYYNLVALGVKLPLVELILIVAGVGLWPHRRLGPSENWMVLAPVAVLLAALSLLSRLNLGIRYLLPVLPFLCLLTGAAWCRVLASRRAGLKALPLLAVAAAGVNIVRSHPNYLAFFNLVPGGSARGHEWLVDSNLDWGQDLYRVREAVQPLVGDRPVRLLYFGHVDPELYGIRYTHLPPVPVEDVMVISRNYLVGNPYVVMTSAGKVLHVPPNYAAWLHDYQPVRRLGSILVFDTRR